MGGESVWNSGGCHPTDDYPRTDTPTSGAPSHNSTSISVIIEHPVPEETYPAAPAQPSYPAGGNNSTAPAKPTGGYEASPVCPGGEGCPETTKPVVVSGAGRNGAAVVLAGVVAALVL